MRILLLGGAWVIGVSLLAGCHGDPSSGDTDLWNPGPPTLSRGARAVTFLHPDPKCKIAAHNRAIGEVAAGSKPMLVEDGASGVFLACAVVAKGSTFRIAASENDKDSILTLIVEGLVATASKELPQKGTVSYQSPVTGLPFTSPDCNFYFLPGTGQGIQSGKAWLTFDCPTIAEAADDVCKIEPGYAAFEACQQTDL